jgi:UDP-galactopyranose mutase
MIHRRPAIVCFSNLDWSYLRYRKQHLMERLSKHVPVVYVNPPRAMKWRTPRRWNRLQPHGPQLWVYDPIVLPGVRRSAAVRALNQRLIGRALAAIPALAGPRLAWVYSPHAYGLLEHLDPTGVVYDMADDYTVPSGVAIRDANEAHEITRLAELEAAMLRRADLVFCVSEPLLDRARAANARAHLLPNGCDLSAYRDAPPPADAGSRPVIGYVGTIAPRVDVELLAGVAAARPDWTFEIVGPVSPLVRLDRSACPPNVHWRGEVPYAEVPSRICQFDVGILPLREIAFSNRCSPIQVFDYLAAGKPVVSTPVAQLERLPRLVRTARGVNEFVSAIEQALADRSPAAGLERRAFASANSWDARVDEILSILDEVGLAGSRPPRAA